MIGMIGICISLIFLAFGLLYNNGGNINVRLVLMGFAIIMIFISFHFLDDIECRSIPTSISVDNEHSTQMEFNICRNKPYNGQWGEWYPR